MSIPLPLDDPFLPALGRAIDRNFPEVMTVQDLGTPILPPLAFYDRHLSSHLLLKRIRIAPSLHESLASNATESLRKFVNDGYRFDTSSYERTFHNNLLDAVQQADSVGREHFFMFGMEMTQLATKILMTPNIPQWLSLFLQQPPPMNPPPGTEMFAEGYLMVHMSGDKLALPPNEKQYLPKQTHKDVLKLNNVFDWLASWNFLSNTKRGKAIVSQVPATPKFPWESAHTSGILDLSSHPTPPDAEGGLAAEEIKLSLSRKRKVADTKAAQAPRSSSRTVKVPAKKARRPYLPNARDYIQKAWCTSVLHDTTYIVFNCGSYERIGIRHRASQTLYLSHRIDTAHTNPSYGRIQLGLYLAILQDAISRRDARKKFNRRHNLTLKRVDRDQDDLDDIRPSKRRRKGDAPDAVTLLNSSETDIVTEAEKEMARKDALLINLNYGDYNSPTPSCFIRIGSSCVQGLFVENFASPARKSTYTSGQYMTATLRAPLGTGAIGTAHRASLDLLNTAGTTLNHQCLVKLAFSPEARSALTHEFDIYQHFAKKDMVAGIVRVHGLFQDTQTETLALLMDFGGFSLRQRECDQDPDFTGVSAWVSGKEADAITRALQLIHDTGICHKDMRIDNIVLNNKREIAIIDFDQAGPPDGPEEYEEEMDGLKEYLYGGQDTSSGSEASQSDDSI